MTPCGYNSIAIALLNCLSSSPRTDRRTDRQTEHPCPSPPFPQPRACQIPLCLSFFVVICAHVSLLRQHHHTHPHAQTSGHGQTQPTPPYPLPPTFPPTGFKNKKAAAGLPSARKANFTYWRCCCNGYLPTLPAFGPESFFSLSLCVRACCLHKTHPGTEGQVLDDGQCVLRWYHAGADGEGKRIGRLQHRFLAAGVHAVVCCGVVWCSVV
ncbi:hypothetical protein B0T22DRAFT_446410 [Podospora appendiculata]|uniref:Uncharacterized protein n=1 Tax=Podospora appendiculata TaxID=314037 RepID=A0AAE0XEN4_9PEZI|nr:hypothetical protein B0T22DRAFT_446410 [Podospora appendiculata]